MPKKIVPFLLILMLNCANGALAEKTSPQNAVKNYPPYVNELKDTHLVGNDPFLHAVKSQLVKCWFPPKTNEKHRIKFRFVLDKLGSIDSSQILESSGSKNFDNAAIDALYAEDFKFSNVVQPDNINPMEFTFAIDPGDDTALESGLRDEAVWRLEEGANLYPNKEIFRNLIRRIKSHEI